MKSFSVIVTKCVLCPWLGECEVSEVHESTIPDICPNLIASNLRYELLESIQIRDNAANFMITYGSPESRKAIGFSDEGWIKKRNVVRKEQNNIDRILSQIDSQNIAIEDHIRNSTKDWYSIRIEELED